ncbi:MAG: putative Ig domain-containing protein, partial [Verrucomicrobia bacterium]|nr:putative Ig domain-containing protein [Verrucomicrobiota bacterium]
MTKNTHKHILLNLVAFCAVFLVTPNLFGTTALLVGLNETSRIKESINIQFAKSGVPENVTGFDASDVTVTGGTLSNFTQISASNYSMDVKVNSWPGQATLSIAAGAAKDSANVDTPAMSSTINYIEGAVTRASNMLAHWKFDEGTGSETFDSSAKGNHMGIGGATWTTGKFGNAFSYDAKSTALPLSAHPPASGTAYSISFWMNGDTAKLPGKATSIMESAGTSGRVINLHWPWNNNNVYFDSGHGSYDRINIKPPNADDNPGPLWGQWTHYVVTHNRGAGTMRIYQNEIQIGIGTGKTKSLGPPVRWFLGSHSGGNGSWWYGKIDDLRIYDAELAASEVEDIYAGDIWPQLNPIITADDAGKRIQTVTVNFKVETTATSVTGFTAADLNVTGGAVTDFTGSGSTYTFTLTPTTYPSDVSVNIPLHSVESADGNYANISTTATWPFKLPGIRNDSHGGLALWLDGNEITDVVVDPDAPQTITTWSDASGAGNHMSNVVGDPKLVEGPNGHQVVQYTNDRTYTTKNFEGDLLPVGYTAFGVSRYTGGDNERVISSSNNWLFGHHGNQISRHHFNTWIDTGGIGSDTAFHVFVASNEPSKANNENVTPKAWIWMDGVLRKDGVNSHDNNPAPQTIMFGAHGNGSETSNCEVAEFILYKGQLLEENRKKVEGYLAQKWGINLPSSHPYMGDDPYANAVAPKVTTTKLAGNVGLNVKHYKISGSFSPNWFGIYQAPAWMSVNSSTGQLSGTPTAAGSFNVTLIVSTANGLTGAWQTKIKVTAAPSVTADAASEIGLYGADLTGAVTGTGGDTTVDVWAYYGLVDAGDDPLAWEKAIKIGAYENTNTFRARALGLFLG